MRDHSRCGRMNPEMFGSHSALVGESLILERLTQIFMALSILSIRHVDRCGGPPASIYGGLGVSVCPLYIEYGEGHLNKHIRRCHEVYSARRERILARLGGDLAPWFSAIPASAGFHLSALATPAVDVELLANLARKVEVGLYSLAPFFSEAPVRPGLLMGFGAIELLDIDPALDRVRDTLQRLS